MMRKKLENAEIDVTKSDEFLLVIVWVIHRNLKLFQEKHNYS